MNKILLFSILIISCLASKAENLLQILPQQVEKGMTFDDDHYLTVQLCSEEPYVGFIFDIYFPEGMGIDMTADPMDNIYYNTDRFPYTVGKKGVINFKHNSTITLKPDGGYRITVKTETLDPNTGKLWTIEPGSGDAFEILYISDADMPEGQLPIRFENVQFAISGTQGIKPPTCSGYVYTEGYNPAESLTLDLGDCIGYMPEGVTSFVEVSIIGHLLGPN